MLNSQSNSESEIKKIEFTVGKFHLDLPIDPVALTEWALINGGIRNKSFRIACGHELYSEFTDAQTGEIDFDAHNAAREQMERTIQEWVIYLIKHVPNVVTVYHEQVYSDRVTVAGILIGSYGIESPIFQRDWE